MCSLVAKTKGLNEQGMSAYCYTGSYQIPVTVKLPEGFELLDDVVADVTISEITNADSNNG